MKLALLENTVAVCRLDPESSIPEWAIQGSFFSITKTDDELSVVCDQENVPHGTKAEMDWRIFKVEGPLPFELTGILASIANPLSKAKISIFAISTFETDYILVKADDLEDASLALVGAGFSFN